MREKYVPPTIESAEVVEQTSLACTVTSAPDYSSTCAASYRKSEAYFNDEALVCDTVLYQPECMVVLS